MQTFDLPRRLVAEALGTALLVATVVGSGIMAESLTRDVALALLGNTLPTGAILVVLIAIFGPISGAHFNPAVTLVFAIKRDLIPRDAFAYVAAQIAGGMLGTMTAHAMFALPLFEASLKLRAGGAQWLAEGVAAFGLIATILGGIRFERAAVPWLVGLYILVHVIDSVCQSGRRDREVADEYVCRNSSGRPSRVCHRRALRRARGNDADELAVARARRGRPDDEGGLIMSVTIYHNPDCGTSRNTLAMIRQSGEAPEIIEYLKTPPSRARLIELIKAMGIPVRALLREKGTPYAELGLADPKWSDDQLLDFMLAHPILINRPIVVTPKGTKLCRPSEAVLDLLERPAISFVKEDGEVVARGK
jgi:arsenate reductase (glutaredoxin)